MGGTFGASVTLYTLQAATLPQYGHFITNDDDIEVPAGQRSELEPDANFLGRLFRDPGDPLDTFSGDAFVTYVDLHYEIGQRATRERNRPFSGL